jgi:hypothetical protein
LLRQASYTSSPISISSTASAGRTKAEDLIDKHDYLRIDNNHRTAEAAARTIVEAFTLA